MHSRLTGAWGRHGRFVAASVAGAVGRTRGRHVRALAAGHRGSDGRHDASARAPEEHHQGGDTRCLQVRSPSPPCFFIPFFFPHFYMWWRLISSTFTPGSVVCHRDLVNLDTFSKSGMQFPPSPPPYAAHISASASLTPSVCGQIRCASSTPKRTTNGRK